MTSLSTRKEDVMLTEFFESAARIRALRDGPARLRRPGHPALADRPVAGAAVGVGFLHRVGGGEAFRKIY